MKLFHDFKSLVEHTGLATARNTQGTTRTSINNLYLEEENLNVEVFGRGMSWLDTGTFDSLHQAGSYIRILEKRQGLKIGCPYEVAWRKGWINGEKFKSLANNFLKSSYGDYFICLLEQKNNNLL